MRSKERFSAESCTGGVQSNLIFTLVVIIADQQPLSLSHFRRCITNGLIRLAWIMSPDSDCNYHDVGLIDFALHAKFWQLIGRPVNRFQKVLTDIQDCICRSLPLESFTFQLHIQHGFAKQDDSLGGCAEPSKSSLQCAAVYRHSHRMCKTSNYCRRPLV